MFEPCTPRIPLALAFAIAPFLALSASAQLLAYDGFGNGPAPDLGGSTGGTGWTSAWSDASTDPTGIGRTGLNYNGLALTAGAAVTPTAGGVWPSSMYARSFQAPPAGTNVLYASFLMRDDAAYGMWGGVSFGQYPYKMTVGSPLGYYAYGLMMSQGLGDVSNKQLVQGETTLVVVKISKNPGGPGVTYSMYLDPTIGAAEPSFAAATFTLGPVSALPTAISIDNGTGFTTDELRIGTTWGSVLPAAPSNWTDLGFAKPGVDGAPHLVGTGSLTAGSLNSVALTNAKPVAPAWLVIGANAVNLPILGGVLVPEPSLVIGQTTSHIGTGGFQALWQPGVPAGVPIRFQYWIMDAAATFGFSASNGLQGVSQ
jgi:hypothetical protein